MPPWWQAGSSDGAPAVQGGSAVGRFFGETARKARDAHDRLVLLRHAAAHGPAPEAPGEGGPTLAVELCAAADLRSPTSALGKVDSYCELALGEAGARWAAKCGPGPRATTPVALRQCSPRWGATCSLPLPGGAQAAELELSVRVMLASAVQGDRVLGEARVPLAETAGAATVRLQGAGFASLSLRWCTLVSGSPGSTAATLQGSEDQAHAPGSPQSPAAACQRAGGNVVQMASPRELRGGTDAEGGGLGRRWDIDAEYGALGPGEPGPRGADPFEEALTFWAALARGAPQGLQGGPGPFAARLLAAGEDEALLNELVLQAPLGQQICGAREPLPPLLDALAARQGALSPLACSRVAGALTERVCGLGPEAPRAREVSALCELFETSQGEDLVRLKRFVDAAGADHDMRQVVFSAIPPGPLRQRVLDHFRQQAAELDERPNHVLSDIDNTVWVGTFGTGGPKFPQGPVPGAVALYNAVGGHTTFLSARPPVWMANTRRLLLDEVGVAEAVVLPGTLKNAVHTLFRPEQAHRAMGERKLEVFLEFAELHPEARFIFFGDSGEGDVDFALQFMSTHDGLARDRRDRAALIHDVALADGVVPKTPAARRQELRLGGVIVFDTFAGAAVELARLGLLGADGLRAAAHRCLEEFGDIPPEEFASPEVFEVRRNELLRDLQKVNEELRRADAHPAPGAAPGARGAASGP
ncbi:unnamed protein product [Prorocentrum cordatum]|uniref:C2 domain-containing protein n=1 Tax=Prorocentrum cordatum TaxID=2364126 RepID=A0ABN9TMZ7_9DINO|nr:unnamed protein product [Polarella glacialis]